MTLPRTLSTYGGEFTDAYPVEDPNTTQAAAYYNRHAEDTAEMSRTTTKVRVQFQTTTDAAPVAVTALAGRCHAGAGSGNLPTIEKTATGTYEITYPTTWTDSLGTEESVGFTFARAQVHGTTPGHAQPECASNVITVYVMDPASAFALSDLGDGITIEVAAE
jgi:hypothetical protein